MKQPQATLQDAVDAADLMVTVAQEMADTYVRLVDRPPDMAEDAEHELVSDVLVAYARFWIQGRHLLAAVAKELDVTVHTARDTGGWDF